eukprot:Gb_38305 [translate_table: standard]
MKTRIFALALFLATRGGPIEMGLRVNLYGARVSTYSTPPGWRHFLLLLFLMLSKVLFLNPYDLESGAIWSQIVGGEDITSVFARMMHGILMAFYVREEGASNPWYSWDKHESCMGVLTPYSGYRGGPMEMGLRVNLYGARGLVGSYDKAL